MRKGLVILSTAAALGALALIPAPVGAGSIVGSCTIANGISCSDYENLPEKKPKEMCLKYGGKWSAAACPTAKRVGTCTQTQSGGKIRTHSYPPSTVEVARKACANTPGGKFSAK